MSKETLSKASGRGHGLTVSEGGEIVLGGVS